MKTLVLLFGALFAAYATPAHAIEFEEGYADPASRAFYCGASAHCIEVSVREKFLRYYQRGRFLLGVTVIPPPQGSLEGGVARGVVTEIIYAPSWCPGDRARRKYGGLYLRERGVPLPRCIPYGDPWNPMGDAKFKIDWGGTYDRAALLHGTPDYPEMSRGYEHDWWQIDTLGCVRLLNEVILELARLVRVEEGVSVVLYE